MIDLYAFDNANADGNKEAVVVPNVPTLVNKLSANETNRIKDKINEVVAVVNLNVPTSNVVDFLELRLKLKGSQSGIANQGDFLEVGDVVHGFSQAGVIWTDAVYNGGDPTVRANYTSNIYVRHSELSNPDRIITLGTETKVDNTYTYQDYVWSLNGEQYTNETPDVLTIAPATPGFKRKDISVFTNNGTIGIVQGIETDGATVTTPEVPDGTLYFKFYDIDGAVVVDDPTPPITGTQFIKKSDFQTVENTQLGTDVIVGLPLNGASYINFTNPLLESIKGVVFFDPIDEASDPPYNGKPFIFKNLTGNPITIKNNQTVLFFQRAFLTKDGLDIVIPNGEHIRFNYGVKLEDSFRSWSEDVLETKNKLITIPLSDLGVDIEDVTYEMVSDYITNLGIVVEKGENYYFEVIEVPTYNFDLTSPNWASEGVTDEASFINWLAIRSYYYNNDLTNIVVTDFNFEVDRVFCNMTADGTTYDLSNLGLVNADKIGVVKGLTILALNSNQIVTFNPTTALPSSLTELYLSNNRMTLADYTASETWATNQPAFTNPCYVVFNSNIDSITGTNLEAILISKGCIIIP